MSLSANQKPLDDSGTAPSQLSPSRPLLEEHVLTRKIDPANSLGAWIFILLFTVISSFHWQGRGAQLVATQNQVFRDGEWWRLFTSVFVHSDITHLLANSALFVVFATFLRNYFGRWAFPIISTIGAAVTAALALLTYPPEVRLIGASGMVYLMSGMWMLYFARYADYLSYTQRAMRLIAYFLMVLLPTQIEPNVSYRTHYIGFGLGLFLAWLSLPWMKPLPFTQGEKEAAEARAARRRRWFDEEDEVLTALAEGRMGRVAIRRQRWFDEWQNVTPVTLTGPELRAAETSDEANQDDPETARESEAPHQSIQGR